MLPQPIFNFENFKDLDTIVKLKRLQKQVTYFCTRPLDESFKNMKANFKVKSTLLKGFLTKVTIIKKFILK
jgi:hypothetical protein